ncbi:MAG TPA: winged helix-turn-helix domain-containing protein [Pyrinomonadaceae bacterium]|nr:winged helix-turn-helix domain-containing protein [Pyrinomonadaceae bacterium]
MSLEEKELYEFGPFRLDVQEHIFERSDGASNDSLPEKAFQTLCVLVRNRGRLLTKQELFAQIWPDSFVEENNLDKCIHAIRHALNEKPGEQKYIETVRKHGYRFVGDVRQVASKGPSVLEAEAIKADIPSRLNRRKAGYASLGVLLILFIAISGFYYLRTSGVVGTRKISIAILPFEAINAADSGRMYEIGITEALIHHLNSTAPLVIRPLNSVRKYSNGDHDPVAIGREQNADFVLVSKYQLADGRIRVTAQLISVADGHVEESLKIEEHTANLFAMQDAIAAECGNEIVRHFALSVETGQ